MTTINLNALVQVSLTKRGIEMVHSSDYCTPMDISTAREKGIWIGPLWQLAHVFGEVLYNGQNNLPFSSMTIKIIEPNNE